ncbi:MAG TPA: hypothetical protein VN843_29330 [Anaerolineales bacterium]|nr:hypothetical protein [Anaerolineales bacterium]
MDEWGEWECPVCMDGKKYSDPDAIRGTTCDNGHTILLGPVHDGYRWAEEMKGDLE